MKYIIDNDLHIHSKISLCSGDDEQTSERILKYAKDNNIKTICLTDHFWDSAVCGASEWYKIQNYNRISAAKPLPADKDVRFLFGCETELDKNLTLGISKKCFDSFDFVVIPTTHFHMVGFTNNEKDISTPALRAETWIKRLKAVLSMDLPFEKIGIAHLTCGLIAPTREEYLETLSLLPEEEMRVLFSEAAKVRVGIELNSEDMKLLKVKLILFFVPIESRESAVVNFTVVPMRIIRARWMFQKGISNARYVCLN